MKDFSMKTTKLDLDSEFPVCEEEFVGKEWTYTYLLTK